MRNTKDDILFVEKKLSSSSTDINQYHFLQQATSTLTEEAEALIQETYGSEWTNDIDSNAFSFPSNSNSDQVTNQPQGGENIFFWDHDVWDLDSNGYKDLISALYDDLLRVDNDGPGLHLGNCDHIKMDKMLPGVQKQSCSSLYKCSECNYLTNSRTQFWRHRKSSVHIMNMEQMERTSPSSSNCKTSSKKITCKECGYFTKSSFNLKRHFIRTHTEEKSSHCKYCAKSFKDSDTMRTHIARIHYGESSFTSKEYKCSECDQTFRSSSDCSRHQKIVHQNRRQFQCPHCKKSFQTGTNARRHYTNVCSKKKRIAINKSTLKADSTSQLNKARNQNQLEF